MARAILVAVSFLIGSATTVLGSTPALESKAVTQFRNGSFLVLPDHELLPDARASALLGRLAERFLLEDGEAAQDPALLALRTEDEQVSIDASRVAELVAFIKANPSAEASATAVLLVASVVQGTEKQAHDTAITMLRQLSAEHPELWQGQVAPVLVARLVCDGRRRTPEARRIRDALSCIPIPGADTVLPENDPGNRAALRVCELEHYGGSIERMILASHVAGNWRLYQITRDGADFAAAKAAAQRLTARAGSGPDFDLARVVLATIAQ